MPRPENCIFLAAAPECVSFILEYVCVFLCNRVRARAFMVVMRSVSVCLLICLISGHRVLPGESTTKHPQNLSRHVRQLQESYRPLLKSEVRLLVKASLCFRWDGALGPCYCRAVCYRWARCFREVPQEGGAPQALQIL